MNRSKKALKNIMFGYLGTIINLILKFTIQTIFIKFLGAELLGVNGLYTNILSVLSLAELGIGTAMNFSLYKPVAENDYEKVKSLMKIFKKTYRNIAFIIMTLGLILLPFLEKLVINRGEISVFDLKLYYLIFLFNTVTTYFVSYKFSLSNAEQKNYIYTNIKMLSGLFSGICQIIIIVIYKNFLLYLIIVTITETLHKIYTHYYFKKNYIYLNEKNVQKIEKQELKELSKNIRALIFHKIGSVSVHSTDNIIIASFIGIKEVGIISNYSLILLASNSIINVIFNSLTSSFGNLVATENSKKQLELFNIYRFLGFYIFGGITLLFLLLLNPFIELWFGGEYLIDKLILIVILLNYYLMGQRIVVNNFKIASGNFDSDKYVALAQAVLNLLISIVLVKKIGLLGIYIGTLIQGLLATLIKPFYVYKFSFDISSKWYYISELKRVFLLISIYKILEKITDNYALKNTWSNLAVRGVITVIFANIVFLIIFYRSKEMKYFIKKLKKRGVV